MVSAEHCGADTNDRGNAWHVRRSIATHRRPVSKHQLSRPTAVSKSALIISFDSLSSFGDDRGEMPQFLPRPGRRDVEVGVAIMGDDGVHEGMTRNIGTGGACIVSDWAGVVGERVGLQIDLPGLRQPMLASAEIRWVSAHHGMGIKFVDLHLWSSAHLAEFLDQVT
jgi:hypothetical protein